MAEALHFIPQLNEMDKVKAAYLGGKPVVEFPVGSDLKTRILEQIKNAIIYMSPKEALSEYASSVFFTLKTDEGTLYCHADVSLVQKGVNVSVGKIVIHAATTDVSVAERMYNNHKNHDVSALSHLDDEVPKFTTTEYRAALIDLNSSRSAV